MEGELRTVVAKYGFSAVYTGLINTMREEYTFLHSHFGEPSIPTVVAPPVKEKKVRKVKEKKVVDTEIRNEPAILSEVTPEVKDIVVTEKGVFRDPKEMKEHQKKAEEEKRKENEAAGIQLFQILTKENLKRWVEDEGHTYAWVAREKAGCAETQVAATAQMMGIKSKISKLRGRIMSGR
jgi:DNA-binding TFAR19-related protein (PDSD5 family)